MEVQMEPPSLGWGRATDGRFVITVNQSNSIVQAYLLSPEEEQALRAALMGILVGTPTPAPHSGAHLALVP